GERLGPDRFGLLDEVVHDGAEQLRLAIVQAHGRPSCLRQRSTRREGGVNAQIGAESGGDLVDRAAWPTPWHPRSAWPRRRRPVARHGGQALAGPGELLRPEGPPSAP